MRLGNYHNHTGNLGFSYCADSDLTLEWYLAQETEWSRVAITDHGFNLAFPNEIAWGFKWHKDPRYFEEYRDYRLEKVERYLEMLSKLDGEFFLPGIEIEVTSWGDLTIEEQYLPHFQIILGAIHHLSGQTEEEILASFWQQINDLLRYPVDIIAHPFRILERKLGEIPLQVLDRVVQQVTAAGVALELNSHYICSCDELMLKLVCKYGGKIAIGTDTHARRELFDASYHFGLFERLGIVQENIFVK